ncbi:cupin domain-containing protein [Microbulbifer sp. EKSA008]|uniref:cupin domain-containing protein n=1 Tax=unclassified Microbulbifer TaxID=2619833 RepID=UPI002B293D20|nr:cupin domain-containing protein [Microbulbifer sp. MKSA007]
MKPDNLIDHPEGGKFLQVFKSSSIVTREDGQKRSALTHIYFSLQKDEVSRFHRVESDEVWNLYRGEGLYLYIWTEGDSCLQRTEISAKNNIFCHVVPAGAWQAAEPIGSSVLVGCSVGPGFEFSDFNLIKVDDPVAKQLCEIDSCLSRFIR